MRIETKIRLLRLAILVALVTLPKLGIFVVPLGEEGGADPV